MEISGKVIEIMPVDSFTKDGKNYDTQDIIIQTQEQYPKKVALHIFGSERIQHCQVQIGEIITASFDLSSRDFTDKNGSRRWSSSVNVWQIAHGANQQVPQQAYAPQAQGYAPQTPQYAPQPQAPFPPQQPAYQPQQPAFQPQQPAFQPQQPQMPFPPQMPNPNDNPPF